VEGDVMKVLRNIAIYVVLFGLIFGGYVFLSNIVNVSRYNPIVVLDVWSVDGKNNLTGLIKAYNSDFRRVKIKSNITLPADDQYYLVIPSLVAGGGFDVYLDDTVDRGSAAYINTSPLTYVIPMNASAGDHNLVIDIVYKYSYGFDYYQYPFITSDSVYAYSFKHINELLHKGVYLIDIGILFVLGILLLLLYISTGKVKYSYLLFSLAFFLVFLSSIRDVMLYLPIDYAIVDKIRSTALMIGAPMFLHAMIVFLNGKLPLWKEKAFRIYYGLILLLLFIPSYSLFTRISKIVYVGILILYIYVTVLYIVRANDSRQILILSGLSFMGISYVVAILWALGIISYPINPVVFGLFVATVVSSIALIVDVAQLYNDAIRWANDATTQKNKVESMMDVVRDTTSVISTAVSDLTSISSDVATLSKDMNVVSDELSREMNTLSNAISLISDNIDSVRKASHSLAQSATTLSDFSGTMRQRTIENVSHLGKVVDSFKGLSQKMQEVNSLAEKFSKVSGEVSGIVDEIRNIAKKTNLLALNAAIEAAKAGEAGKGFAVVADEVRKLAEMTTESVGRIEEIMKSLAVFAETIAKDVRETTESIDEATNSGIKVSRDLEVSVEDIERLSSMAEDLAAVSEELLASTEQVKHSSNDLLNLSNVVQKAIGGVEVSVDNQGKLASKLTDVADVLREKVNALMQLLQS